MEKIHSDIIDICGKDGYEIRRTFGTNDNSDCMSIDDLKYTASQIHSFVPRCLSSCWIIFGKRKLYLIYQRT